MEKIKTAKSGYRWVILALYMYVTALTQLFWLNFASIDTFMESFLGVSAMKVGLLAMIFPLTYLVISIPSGIIIDKKGFKFSVSLGAGLTMIFSLFRLISPGSYGMLLVSQLGISLGQPFVLNSMTKLATEWFPADEEATAVGLGSISLFIGMLISLGATPLLVEKLGFTEMLLIYSGMAFIGFLLFTLFVKEKPAMPSHLEATSPAGKDVDEITSYREGLKQLFGMRDFLLLGFLALIGIGAFNGLATWLEKILSESHGITMIQAGNISGALVFSGMTGCIVLPLLSDRVKKRRPFIIVDSIIAVISMIILIFARGYILNLLNGILLGFFLISALPIMLTMSAEIAGPKLAGVSVGYLQLLGNGAAVLIVPAMEYLRNLTSRYTLSLVFLGILFVISTIFALLIRESITDKT